MAAGDVSIGKNCKVCLGITTVLDMADWSLTREAPLLEAEVYGAEDAKVYGTGIRSSSGSFSGLLNTSDITGQNVLYNASVSGTAITDLRLYISDTEYWASNVAEDTDACAYVTNYAVTTTATDISKVSMDFKFSGKVHKTS